MRLYCKLALLVVIACAGQVAISSGVAGETYFALRCLAAATTGDATAEAVLIGECETKLRTSRGCQPITIVALNTTASPR